MKGGGEEGGMRGRGGVPIPFLVPHMSPTQRLFDELRDAVARGRVRYLSSQLRSVH